MVSSALAVPATPCRGGQARSVATCPDGEGASRVAQRPENLLAMGVSLAGVSLPMFFTGQLALLLFSYKLEI
ncbi:hypothetical protein ACWDO5_35090, partial [Streptomyces sp. NPDC000880]